MWSALLCLTLWPSIAAHGARAPNVLVLLVDDLGYGDVPGNVLYSTPEIDRLAAEGARFTQWISASSICTPSRAALLTGRLPQRYGMASSDWRFRVVNSLALPGGLPHREDTLAELLRDRGYDTRLVGKWHLGVGDGGEHLPTRHGFDGFYGFGGTNVQTCDPSRTIYRQRTLAEFVLSATGHLWLAAALGILAAGPTGLKLLRGRSLALAVGVVGAAFAAAYFYAAELTFLSRMSCVLWRDEEIVQQPATLEGLTQRLTADASRFIAAHSAPDARPFFLVMSYLKVHTALFAAPEFVGRSRGGAYGDNVEELDWSVGEIMRAVRDAGARNSTLTVFLSDNGPYLERGAEGGSALPLRGGKGQNWEGGIRVPGILHWPGRVSAGAVVDDAVSTMDVLPTALAVADEAVADEAVADEAVADEAVDAGGGVKLSRDRGRARPPRAPLDGKDLRLIVPGLANAPAPTRVGDENPTTRSRAMVHYCGQDLHAVRVRGRFKAHLFTAVPESGAEALGGRAGSCPARAICGCRGLGHTVVRHDPPMVFDVLSDPGETRPLSAAELPAGVLDEVDQTVAVAASDVAHEAASVENQLESFARPWLMPCCRQGEAGGESVWSSLLHLSATACRCDRDATGGG
jgi:arylsulfatase A-like enzyme